MGCVTTIDCSQLSLPDPYRKPDWYPAYAKGVYLRCLLPCALRQTTMVAILFFLLLKHKFISPGGHGSSNGKWASSTSRLLIWRSAKCNGSVHTNVYLFICNQLQMSKCKFTGNWTVAAFKTGMKELYLLVHSSWNEWSNVVSQNIISFLL